MQNKLEVNNNEILVLIIPEMTRYYTNTSDFTNNNKKRVCLLPLTVKGRVESHNKHVVTVRTLAPTVPLRDGVYCPQTFTSNFKSLHYTHKRAM